MRSMSAAFVAAIALGTVKIAELYILEMGDGTTYRYTTHNVPKIWDAENNTYNPIVAERGGVSFTTNFEVGEVGVSLSYIGSDIGNDVNNDILERAVLTIKRIRWDADYAPDEELTIFKGFLDIDFNRRVLNLSAKSKFANLNVQIPKFLYEECCNYNLFDNMCGLERADYAYSGTATDGSRTTVIDSNRGSVFKVAFDTGDSENPIERGGIITGGGNGYTAEVVQIVYLTPTTGYLWYVELSNSNNFDDDETLTAPGTDELLYENYALGDNEAQGSYPGHMIGQTFTPQITHPIRSVKLKVYRLGTLTDVTVSIYASAGGHPIGGSLCSVAVDGSGWSTSPAEIEWVFLTNPSLAALDQFAIVIEDNSYNSSNCPMWRVDGISPTYADGTLEYHNGAIWITIASKDCMFKEYGFDVGGSIKVNGTPAADPTFYELGEIEMISGDNSGQKRPIALDSAGTLTTLWPFVSAIATSDTYKIYPGCDLRGITCHQKFHNEDIFRGFLYVPRVEDTIM